MSIRATLEQDNHWEDDNYISSPEPHPDYISTEKSQQFVSHFRSHSALEAQSHPAREPQTQDMSGRSYPLTSDDAVDINDSTVVKPKTSFISSFKESKERQALHKELLMNYQMRKDVLQNTELNRALRERREKERKREWDVETSASRRTSLQIKLEERANRIKEEEDMRMRQIPEATQTHELTRVHRMITLKSPKSTE